MTEPSAGRELERSSRFSVRRRLEAGGFGVVFEAHDRERNALVAVKVLARTDGEALYRFKREFRALADLTHPNLATLHELVVEQDLWLLTMELVDGVPFLDDVRPAPEGAVLPTASTAAVPDATRSEPLEEASVTTPEIPDAPGRLDLDRLRSGLAQLARGLGHLHDHGILHRDIKPSNVLVEPDGRLAILDFGLVAELRTGDGPPGAVPAGTPAYMSPEDLQGDPPAAPGDWYAVGVMLYRALTGRLPFTGSALEQRADKRVRAPIPPRRLAPEVPAELDALCLDLLRQAPGERPDAGAVLERLGQGSPSEGPSARHDRDATTDRPFVGRRSQLDALSESLAEVRAGRPGLVLIAGPSGIGKTALVRRFLSRATVRDDVLVLQGRCYEQEAVPYKALDEIVDALARRLARLAPSRAAEVLPGDFWALRRVFPVFRMVDVASGVAPSARIDPEPRELRRRASAAFRDLLARLSRRVPLVLFVDDLQWGDEDSAGLLTDLYRAPSPPSLLLLGCFRQDDATGSPLVSRLAALADEPACTARVRRLDVPELDPEEAEALVRLLTTDGAPLAPERVGALATESGGHPFFLDQLVGHGPGDPGASSLEALLAARTAELPAPSRRLLQVTAVAGRPVSAAVAMQAADLPAGDRQVIAALRADRLIRTRTVEGQLLVESFHDRIRETVAAALPEDVRRNCHDALARALQETTAPDPETLAIHLRESGQLVAAAGYAVAAAHDAMEALAFARAADLYRAALELVPASDHRREALWAGRAAALAAAGQVTDAAHAYLEAATLGDTGDALTRRRLAAEQFLLGGHLREGHALLTELLREVGLRLPATPRRALLSLVGTRLWQRLRPPRFEPRAEADVDPDTLRRVDLTYSVSRCLGLTDPVRALAFQPRHLAEAFRAGEPYRVARALAFEAIAQARRQRTLPRAHELLDEARTAGALRDDRSPDAIIQLAAGMLAFLDGRWRDAVTELRRAEHLFRGEPATLPYDLVVCQLYSLQSLFYLGELAEYAERVPVALAEATDRGDLYATSNLRIHRACLSCFVDAAPDRAQRELGEALEGWFPAGYHLEHAIRLFRQGDVGLYAGRTGQTWQEVETAWPRLVRSRLLQVDVTAVAAWFLRARTALAMTVGVTAPEAGRLETVARRSAAAIERRRTAWGAPLSALIRALLSLRAGDESAARETLRSAAGGFDAAGMGLHAAAVRITLGDLVNGEMGRRVRDEGVAWMRLRAVAEPDRVARMIVPEVRATPASGR